MPHSERSGGRVASCSLITLWEQAARTRRGREDTCAAARNILRLVLPPSAVAALTGIAQAVIRGDPHTREVFLRRLARFGALSVLPRMHRFTREIVGA
jgi:hypothetical protein